MTSRDPTIKLVLDMNRIAYNDNEWLDLTNEEEIKSQIHPILAENISLKKRAEFLVKLVAESEYEYQQIEKQINEANDVLSGLKATLGINDQQIV